MNSLLLSRRDVDFLLFEWLEVSRLTERQAFADHSRQTFDAALVRGGQIARRLSRSMLDGRWTGTMCLSELHAGSSLADITTRAERQPDGSYRLTGNKMWISGGDHDLTDNPVDRTVLETMDELF